MAGHPTAFEWQRVRHHTVILLVAAVDRRIVPALRFVGRLPRADVRALHVSVDPDDTRRLATDWMNLGLTWLPLHVHEPAAETLPASVRQAVEQELDEAGTTTVVVPELDFDRWWQRLLHRGTARRITHQLQNLPNVSTVIVPFVAPIRRRPASGRSGGDGGRRSLLGFDGEEQHSGPAAGETRNTAG